MNHAIFSTSYRGAGLLLCVCFVALVLSAASAIASPGAHGPNGEHLDAPAQAGSTGGVIPRIEARSETFELVGRLQGGELSLLINRYATNEPVLNATVEVETGTLKASAKFHADMGDYAVDDAAMLKALAAAGDHSLVITILAGTDTDLLDGTLNVPGAAAGDDHGHSHDEGHAHGPSRTVWLALALVVLVTVGWLFGRKKAAAPSSVGGAQ